MDSKRWLLRFCGSQVTTEMEAPRSVWLPPPPAAITIGRASMTSASTTMLPSEAPVHVQVTGPRSLARGKLLSRSHLRLETRHDGRGPVGALYATDLGSTNGTYYTPMSTGEQRKLLKNEQIGLVEGDIIGLGHRSLLLYEISLEQMHGTSPLDVMLFTQNLAGKGFLNEQQQQVCVPFPADHDKVAAMAAAHQTEHQLCATGSHAEQLNDLNPVQRQIDDTKIVQQANKLRKVSCTTSSEFQNAAQDVGVDDSMATSNETHKAQFLRDNTDAEITIDEIIHNSSIAAAKSAPSLLDENQEMLSRDISEKKPSQIGAATGRWFWKGDRNGGIQNCWIPYSPELCIKLDKALAAGPPIESLPNLCDARPSPPRWTIDVDEERLVLLGDGPRRQVRKDDPSKWRPIMRRKPIQISENSTKRIEALQCGAPITRSTKRKHE